MVFQNKVSFRPPERHPRALMLGGVSSSMETRSMHINDDSDSRSIGIDSSRRNNTSLQILKKKMVFQSKISFRPPERHPKALLLGVSSSMVAGFMHFSDDSDCSSMSSSWSSSPSGTSDIRFLSEVDTHSQEPDSHRPIPSMDHMNATARNVEYNKDDPYSRLLKRLPTALWWSAVVSWSPPLQSAIQLSLLFDKNQEP
eukprot:scaffold21837_cov60-Attheya_sp.AAC.1